MMSETLITILTSEPVISIYIAVLAVIVGIVVKKYPWIKKYTDVAADVFTWIEDNYKSWGIRGNEKMEYFVKNFIASYTSAYGKPPSNDVLEKAKELVELLVTKQNEAVKEVV